MKKIIFLLLTIFIVFISCSKQKMGRPADLGIIDNLMDGNEWAVITTPYTAFKKTPNINADTINHGRQGDIHLVIGKSIQKSDTSVEIWYQFEEGWIPENNLAIYSNKLKAENVSSSF